MPSINIPPSWEQMNIDMGLNKPTANVLNFGLDYINTQIWKAGDKKYLLNGNPENQNEDSKP
jgi:hypothetical protein